MGLVSEYVCKAASRNLDADPISWSGHMESVDKKVVEKLFEPFPRHANIMANDGKTEEFYVPKRTAITLSQHPRLRRYHPDYDPQTTLDHDPAFMKREVTFFSKFNIILIFCNGFGIHFVFEMV